MRKSPDKISRNLNIQYKNGSKKIWRKFSRRYLALFIFLIFCLSLFFFFNRGFLIHDEGHMLMAGYRIFNGQIIYRDFPFIYPPATAFLYVFSFLSFGESIFAGRIIMLIISLITAFIFYKIGIILFPKSKFVRLVPALIFISWGPTHINFLWPVMLAIAAISASVLFFSIFEKKTKRIYIFFVVFFSLSTLAIKQNFAIVALVNLIIFYLLIKISLRRLFVDIFLKTLTIFTFSVFIYFFITKSFYETVYNLIIKPFDWILVRKIFSTPFVDEQDILTRPIKILIYLSPAIISSAAIFLWKKRQDDKKYLPLLFFPLLFYIAGIRPTTDYVHLAPLISLTGLSLAYLIYVQKKLKKIILIFISISIIFFGYYTALYKGYYRWETPLSKQNIYIENSRVKIFTDEKYDLILKKINSISEKNKNRIFIYPNAPLYYFIIEEKNPIESFMQPAEKIIADLKKNKIHTIITHTDIDSKDKNKLLKYISSEFNKTDDFYEYNIWQKN